MKNPITSEILLTHKEIAKRLDVHRNTISNWIKCGKLKAIRIGGRTLIPASWFEHWIKKTFVESSNKK